MVPSGPPETYGSRTLTLHPEDLEEEQSSGEETRNPSRSVGTLRLRGGGLSSGRKVKWDENVVDNEGMGKKKSKICCIYHRPRQFDESSSDEDSSSCSDDDHDNEGENSHHHHHKKRNGSPNAYERQPHYKVTLVSEKIGHLKVI
ncbi:6668_t:CDS:2 [Cetraspora pellucida]|uniref:Type 1 phosphatases regulator n=1 Tax=Cetraspora pellucida TaxID=1433469 RepID=A0A9N8Z1E2_9GLOM|nr:6668_t:CDS:2 [Cetraspora pellucida]